MGGGGLRCEVRNGMCELIPPQITKMLINSIPDTRKIQAGSHGVYIDASL